MIYMCSINIYYTHIHQIFTYIYFLRFLYIYIKGKGLNMNSLFIVNLGTTPFRPGTLEHFRSKYGMDIDDLVLDVLSS